jgi:hypothetical protein
MLPTDLATQMVEAASVARAASPPVLKAKMAREGFKLDVG